MFLNDIVDAMSIAEAKRTQAQRNREHCRTGWHKEGSKASPTYGKEVKVNNCVKNKPLKEFAPSPEYGGGDNGMGYLHALAQAWYTQDLSLLADIARKGGSPMKKVIDAQVAVEKILSRGVHCPDGKVRKYYIDYNADFDGVDMASHDYYEYADDGENGEEVDSRTGQPWSPYDHIEFQGSDLGESVEEAMMTGGTEAYAMEDEQLDGMALGELRAIAEAAKKIYRSVKQGVPLEAWMYKKITNGNEGLTAVAQQIDNPAVREQQGVAEGSQSRLQPGTHVMLWLGPKDMLPNPPRDDKQYWDRGVVVSEPEMMTGSWQVLVKSQRAGQSPISPARVFVLKQQDVAEGSYDTVTFGVDSEKAYNQVMAKFGKAISWHGDDMTAPRKYWAAIQQLAHDAGGAAEETGYERDVAETTGDKPFDHMMTTIKTGTKKQATADRREQKRQDQERTRAAIDNMFGSSMNQFKNLKIKEQGVAEAEFEPHTAKFGKQVLGHKKGQDEPMGTANIEIQINGRTWKIFPGAGPENSKAWFEQKQKMREMCARKTAQTGKEWKMYITGKPPTVEGVEEGKFANALGAFTLGAAGVAGMMGNQDIDYKGYSFHHAPREMSVPGAAKLMNVDGKELFMWRAVDPKEGGPKYYYKTKAETRIDNAMGMNENDVDEDSWHGEGDAWHGQGQVMEYADGHMVPNDSTSAIPGTPGLDEDGPSRQSLIDQLKHKVDVSHLELLTYDELLKVCKHYGIELNEYNAADPAVGAGPDDSSSPVPPGNQRVNVSKLSGPTPMTSQYQKPMGIAERRQQRLMAVRLAEMRRAGYFD